MNFNKNFFSPFIIEKHLKGKEGGQGLIYLAHLKEDTSLKYIIKKCKKSHLISIKRFEKEIDTINKLQNIEGIIKIKDYNSKKKWYAMPFLQESDILFKKETDLKSKINFLIELGQIIFAVHERGYAHRDIKPGNLLLTEDSKIVLTDFGIVWEINQESITKENEKIGPYSFMAPEMFCYVNKRKELRPADIFSFGQVAYCMFYCKKYGLGTTFIREVYENEEEKQDILMEPFYQFLERATHVNPGKRLEMNECLDLLREFLKILLQDREIIKKWETKKLEREIMTEYEPDGKTYYELIKISSIIKKLAKNYSFFINDNKSIGIVHDCIISDEGIQIIYKTFNKEKHLLCFPKMLEIRKDCDNNLSYSLKIKKIDKKNIEYTKYREYSESINIFEDMENQIFLLNEDTVIDFIETI